MGRPKKIVEEPVVNESNRAELEAKIKELEAQLAAKKEEVEVAPVEEKKEPEKIEHPIPSDYAEAVKTILNQNFKIQMEYSSNTPDFGFSILVPKEYSNAAKPHWEMYGEDRRTRMVSIAEGLNGVKQWCEKVYNNFDNETKAKIALERSI